MSNAELDDLLIWATNYLPTETPVKLSQSETVTNHNLFIESHIYIIEQERINKHSKILKNCVLRLKKYREICTHNTNTTTHIALK